MAIAIKDNTVVAVEKEDTEGTYKAPTSDQSYVQTLKDGTELTPAKELLERNIFTGSIGKVVPRTGLESVTGSLPVEFRAGETEGAEPEYSDLMEAAMGAKSSTVTKSADDTDAGGPHTTSRIYLLDADASTFSTGQTVTVKVAGAYHTSPISATSDTPGDVYIDLLIPAAGAFTDGDAITAASHYNLANSGHPALSVTKYIEDAVAEKALGCKVATMALENFTTGQLASWNFGFEGLTSDFDVEANPFTPDFDSSLPPIILSACVYQDGNLIDVNEVSFSMEQTLGFVTSTCAPGGKISSRATERTITGSFNPYKQDDSVDQYDKFKANQEYSLFITAHLPTGTAGEYTGAIGIYMPKCITTEMTEGDADNLLQNELSFQATRGADSSDDEIYISFN